MPIDPCLQTSSIVVDINLVNDPFYSYTASTLPSVVQQQAYSQFGTLLYETGYTTNGSGSNIILTTSDLWINDTGTNGPLLRSGVWTNIPTSATTHWSPLSVWIGFSQCLTLLEEKRYYVGLGGDNASMLKVNGQIVVKQDWASIPLDNFKYWHIYPIDLVVGHNILEFYGYNQFDVAGFGFEVYDNTYNELTAATSINDLNIIYSTISETGNTFDLCLDSSLSPTYSGYSCTNSGFVYEPCRGRCVKLSAVTINTCSATTEIIKSVITDYRNTVTNQIIAIGYGYVSYNGYLSRQLGLVFTTSSQMSYPDILLSDVIPPTIIYDGVTFITDVVYITEQYQYIPEIPEVDLTTLSIDQAFNPILDNPSVVSYLTLPCVSEPDLTPQTYSWDILKGGSAFGSYYIECSGIIRSVNRCGATIGIVAIDNIDNTIVGVTASVNLYVNMTYTSDRNPNGNVQNAYNQIVAGGSRWGMFGRVKRYHPDSLTNPLDNIGVGLTTVYPNFFDPASSWEQIELSDGMTFYDFATTQELDTYLQPGLEILSVGAGTWAKGELDDKLVVTSINDSILGSVQTNQTSFVQPLYYDCFSFVKSSVTFEDGYICSQAFNTDDIGSAVVAEINGVRKIIGIFIMLGNPSPRWVCVVDSVARAVRIDKVASLLNISPYNGQGVFFSDTDNPIIECEVGMSSDACKIIDGETFCQIGMCYPSVPTNVKYVRNCTTNCVLNVHFMNYPVNNGSFYQLFFEDYLPFGGPCYEILSDSTEMPYITVGVYSYFNAGPPVLGPFNDCTSCDDPCFNFDITVDQILLTWAVGNTDPTKNNTVFVNYQDCTTLTSISKPYTVAGSYLADICNKQSYGMPLMFYYQNDLPQYVSMVNNTVCIIQTNGIPCQ